MCYFKFIIRLNTSKLTKTKGIKLTNHLQELIKKLDLEDFIENFKNFLSRECELFLDGDLSLHLKRIEELANLNLTAPKKLNQTNLSIVKLSKMGICHLDELYNFAKMIMYIKYLKKQNHGVYISEYLLKIEFEQWVDDFVDIFDDEGELKQSVDERLESLYRSLSTKKQELSNSLRSYLSNKALSPYLMDNSLHLQKDCECLLVRSGYGAVIDANIIARSSSGGFYIEPKSVSNIKEGLKNINTNIENIKLEYAKKYSSILSKNLIFLKFLEKTYNLLDSYQARAAFAKAYDYEFLEPRNDGKIKLSGFAHPNLKKPKLINVDFSKKVLLITGVNAGGKSMLLKSMLSASFLCKYLLPMRVNKEKSSVSIFKKYHCIMQDPQDSKNDISTFAGRMQSFARLMGAKDYIVGIDEIELGTDFEEASSLFYVLINTMMKNNAKLIITTHHKRLALMLSKDEDVELLAALYDEKNSMPKYEFLSDSIGKSYAFETALRYGISPNLVTLAKQTYGEEKQNLEAMINKSIELDLKLKKELKLIQAQKTRISNLVSDMKEQKSSNAKTYKEQKTNLEKEYLNAINEAKKTINLKDTKQKQQQINKAWELVRQIKTIEEIANEKFFVGDNVKYGNVKGVIVSINKDIAYIDSDFGKMNVKLSSLKKIHQNQKSKTTNNAIFSPKASVSVNYQRANVLSSIDLHGLRADEALTRLDKFISDALLAGLEEVIVYHGIGTGRLAFMVKEFLKEHKSVKSFSDAPANKGGFGAKIVKF